jgi:TolB protein
MSPLKKNVAIVLVVAFATVVSALMMSAAGRGNPAKTPLAGPWYTHQELKALIRYSNASPAQKKALLAGSKAAEGSKADAGLPLAGPWYTPRELKALTASATVPGVNGLLAYEAKIGKRYQLFTSKPDGSASQQLTDFADSDSVWAAWSPSGSQIAFERDVYTGVFVNRAAIYTMNPDGSGLRSLTPAGLNGNPSWSPNGKLIVFATLRFGKQATVSLMAANGTRVRALVSTPIPKKRYVISFASPTFSPDGKRIAFLWQKRGAAAIFTTSATGGALKQVTPWKNGGFADKIDWSPDGSRIAFSSPGFGDVPGISSNVFTVRPDGTGLVRLTNNRGGKINNGLDSWSPDGKKIAFVSNRAGTYEIYVMKANGSGVTQVTHGPEAHRASWGTHP